MEVVRHVGRWWLIIAGRISCFRSKKGLLLEEKLSNRKQDFNADKTLNSMQIILPAHKGKFSNAHTN